MESRRQQQSMFSILYDFHRTGQETHYRKEKALYYALTNRVIQVKPRRFLVESKRWMASLGKPSVFHIVNWKHDFHFWCDCKHTGVYPSPFNLCSHALAVMLSVSLKERSNRLLLMREEAMEGNIGPDGKTIGADILLKRPRIENVLCYMCKSRVTLNQFELSIRSQQIYELQCNRCSQIYSDKNFNKLIEFNEAYQDVPLTGNEYWDHLKQKKRVHDILKQDGWVTEYEKKCHCRNPHTKLLNRHPYYVDVFAAKKIEGKYVLVGIELNNEKPGGGHGTHRTIIQDRERAKDIEEQFRMKIIPFNIEHLKNAAEDDKIVLTEVYEKVGFPI